MKLLVALLSVALAINAMPAQAEQVAFTHATVVDLVVGKLIRDQTIQVSGTRIVDVTGSSRAEVPQGFRVVNVRGKFVIPGLWDMHAHFLGEATPGCPEVTFPLAIAHGVTGARDVAGHLDYLFAWRAEIESGRMVGPRIIGTGPLVDGVPTVYPPAASVARTPEDGRRIVDSLARRGADFVKGYEMLSRDTFLAVAEQAKKHGLPLVVHVPLSVLANEASDAGVRSFEHLRNLEMECTSDAESLLSERRAMLESGTARIGRELRSEILSAQRMRALDSYDPDRCTALLKKLAANGTWQTPTLFMETRPVFRPDLREDIQDTLRWVPAPARVEWEAWSKRMSTRAPDVVTANKRYGEWQMQLVRRMQEEHVGLLAGTDIATQWTVPGASLHEELRSLVEAGLTPLQALRTATLNPALYFERAKEFGAVAPGQIADLVLLDADPLLDIRNTRRISGVVANGRYFDRSLLDSLLSSAERLARSGQHDVIHRPFNKPQL